MGSAGVSISHTLATIVNKTGISGNLNTSLLPISKSSTTNSVNSNPIANRSAINNPYYPDPSVIEYSYTYSYAYYAFLLLLLIAAIVCIKIGISRRKERENRIAAQRRTGKVETPFKITSSF